MKNKNQEKFKSELIDILSKISFDKVLLKEFLTDLLTPSEMGEISQRWQIVKKLAQKEKHRDIADELGIGVATVTRGSRELRNRNGGFHLALNKTKK